ncbi:MAG TPA: HAD-IB family hydrolase [bacterium]|nr:HAD-IB family hydrolase [bacterium]
MSSIAFFDVDKTVIRGYSGYYTTLELIRRGIIKKRRLPTALFYRAIGPIFHEGKNAPLEKMYQIAINDMAGQTLDHILEVGRYCFDKWLKPRVYQEAIDKIEEHKKAGHPVYLVTSGPYMAIRILGEFLGVEGRFSAGPVIDAEGKLTNELRRPIYYREGKIVAVEEALKAHGVEWKDSYFYSDSIDDLFVLQKVGKPHLVNPDKKLLKVGQERNWPVLRFSNVLGKKTHG